MNERIKNLKKYTTIDKLHRGLRRSAAEAGIAELPEDFRAVVRYLQQDSCPREDLISRIVTPEEALTAMQEWSADPGKVFRILVEF